MNDKDHLKDNNGIYKLTEISISESNSFMTHESRQLDHKLTHKLSQEAVSITTDNDKYKTIRDSFELFIEKNNYEPNKESIYKYFNHTFYKVQKREKALANLHNILNVDEAAGKHQTQKLKAKSQRFNVENYQHILLRSKNENALVKEKVEELTQIYKHYDETMKKYQIISEVTEKELSDIQNRLDQTKSIFVKKIQHNDDQINQRHKLVSQLENSIDKQEKVKKKVHKEEIKREVEQQQQRDNEIAQKKQNEMIEFITSRLDCDMDECEQKYKQMFEQLGTSQVDQIHERIVNEVIPYDIQKQSLENNMRDNLQELGLMQGKKQSLLVELEKARKEYERKYQEDEFYVTQKTKEKEENVIEMARKKEFYIQQNGQMLKLINRVLNQLDSVTNKVNASQGSFCELPQQATNITLFQKVQFLGISLDKSKGFQRRETTARKLVRNMGNSAKRLISQNLTESLLQVEIINDNAVTGNKCLQYWSIMNNQVDKQELKQMRKMAEVMIYENEEDDSEMDDELIAHKTRQKIQNNEKDKRSNLIQQATTIIIGQRKSSNNPIDILLQRRQKLVQENEVEDDSEGYIIQQRQDMKQHNKPDQQQIKVKYNQKLQPQENQLFGKDDYIQTNKDIKRKWYIQNLSNLRKAEKRFRKIYLQMEFQDLQQFDSIEGFFQNEMFIGKSPEEIEQKMKKLKEEDMSRTLSLMSLDFQVQNVDATGLNDDNTIDKNSLRLSTIIKEEDIKKQEKPISKDKVGKPNNQNGNDLQKASTFKSITSNQSQKAQAVESIPLYKGSSVKNQDIERFMHAFDQKIELLSSPVHHAISRHEFKEKENLRKSVFSPPPVPSRQLLFSSQREDNIKSQDGKVVKQSQNDNPTRGNTASAMSVRLHTSNNSRSVATLNAYKFPQIKDLKASSLSQIPGSGCNSNHNYQTQQQHQLQQQIKQKQYQSLYNSQSVKSLQDNAQNNIAKSIEKQEKIMNPKQQSIARIQSVLDSQKHGPRPLSTSYANSLFKLQNIYKLQKPSRRNIDKVVQRDILIKSSEGTNS